MTQTRTIIGGAASVYKVGFFRPYQEYDAVVNPDWRPLNIFSNGAFPYEGQYAPHATVNLGEKVTFSSTFIAYNGVYKNMYVPDYSTTNPEFRTFYVINFFDADVFEFLGIRDLAPRSNIPSWGETKLYYLTKADGSNFSNSNELTLQSTQGLGNGIRGYGQLSDIPAGHKCIGFLWMGKNPPSLGKMHYVMYGADFKIKENVNNIGKYAGIAGTYGSNEAFPYGYSPPPPWWPPPNPPQPWPPGYKPPEWPEPQQYIKFRDLYSLISHDWIPSIMCPVFITLPIGLDMVLILSLIIM